MLRLPDRHPAPAVVADLRAKGISADHRGQVLRLSPGVITTEAGVDWLAEVLARRIRGG